MPYEKCTKKLRENGIVALYRGEVFEVFECLP